MLKPNQKSKISKKSQVEKMFDLISCEYDFLNGIMTFNRHKKWKKNIFNIAKKLKPKNALDIATGTADIAIALNDIIDCKIIGIDISSKMLEVGNKKLKNLNSNHNTILEIGNAEKLKYVDNFFDVITIGYGVRNFINLKKSLNEIYRVLKFDGSLIILETSTPSNYILKSIYLIYTKFYVRLIGWIFSKNFFAYSYLQHSASKFPCGVDFINILKSSGFKAISSNVKFFGASTIYIAKK